MKVIIIDDEKKGIENLTSLLTKYCKNVEIVATSQTIEGAIRIIKENKPELVFLDIEIGNRKSFEILDGLNEIDFEVIFVTAYNQYMLKAFKYSAVDYLLKPVNILELHEAVERVSKRLNKGKDSGSIDLLRELSKKEQSNKLSEKIAIPVQNSHKIVEIDTILRCESDNYYTWIFLNTGEKFLLSKTLKIYDELFSSHGFIRIHQSHLINPKYIVEIKRDTRLCLLIMKDSSNIPVSRQKRHLIEGLMK